MSKGRPGRPRKETRRQASRDRDRPSKPAGEVEALSFDDPPVGRIGDTRSRRKDREEFPPQRVRSAGKTGGECPDSGITADDLAPETLLDDVPSRTPSARQQRDPLDTLLTDALVRGGSAQDDDAGADDERSRSRSGKKSSIRSPGRAEHPPGRRGPRKRKT